MTKAYDQYYQTPALFGEPYPELLHFFKQLPPKSKVLDLGCGQGRNALPLARMGFDIIGIDSSSVGIAQMLEAANAENLKVQGKVADIFSFDAIANYDCILLDSMFHFSKNDREQEQALIERLMQAMQPRAMLVVCIQDTGKKVQYLQQAMRKVAHTELTNQKLQYQFTDQESGHTSKTPYRMVAIQRS